MSRQPHCRLVPKSGVKISPSLRRKIERHEKRHLDKCRQFGADGYWEFDDDGGASFYITRGEHRLTPLQNAAIAYAGNGGSWWAGAGCDSFDERIADRWIRRGYPWGQRSAARREARKLAR